MQELTSVQQWRYVPSEDNPADLISRGTDPERLVQSDIWWFGPNFLMTEKEYSNTDITANVNQVDYNSECKVSNLKDSFKVTFSDKNSFCDNLINLSNNYSKIVRILSFVCRFVQNCKKPVERVSGPISSKELKYAEMMLCKIVQGEYFEREIKSIQRNGRVDNDSKVKTLNPFIDSNNVLRVGGRLANSDLNYDCKYPILLPSNHKLCKLIVEYIHVKYLHVGPSALLFHTRQMFWILNCRSICRNVVYNCIVCFRSSPKTADQMMGNLPRDRVVQNFPFSISGVDFCGPFFIKFKGQRKGTYSKIYVCIFVCFATRAVHLDIVSDLTSDAFIATLKRFISRRGRCSKLYSDNAKNFVGANVELKKLHKLVSQPDERAANFMSSEGIEWKFLPPRAPNFGGLWEAGVKSFKYYLKRTMRNVILTYEEFSTVTAQIEGILNSRPICPLTSSIDDLNVLTPGHFITGRAITARE